MLEEGGSAEPVEDGLGAPVGGFDDFRPGFGQIDEAVQILAGMIEVVGEDQRACREGVADDICDPLGTVADDLHPEGTRCRSLGYWRVSGSACRSPDPVWAKRYGFRIRDRETAGRAGSGVDRCRRWRP